MELGTVLGLLSQYGVLVLLLVLALGFGGCLFLGFQVRGASVPSDFIAGLIPSR